MAMKFMYGGAIMLAGWLWFYLFLRQFFFNILIAAPLTGKMLKTKDDLIDKNAKRYTGVSIVVCLVFTALIAGVIIWLCPLFLMLSFFAGGLICGVMLISKLTPKNRDMFDTFCSAYYRFVPDDELRTAMYNKKPSQMKLRLHDMGLSTDFIPEFEKN